MLELNWDSATPAPCCLPSVPRLHPDSLPSRDSWPRLRSGSYVGLGMNVTELRTYITPPWLEFRRVRIPVIVNTHSGRS